MIGIISDIHGNAPALAAVLAALDGAGVERVISLGDVAGYYCAINECIEILRARNVTNILGNHDDYLVGGNECPRSTSVNRCLDHQRRVLREDNRVWLARSPPRLDLGSASMVHGGWNDPLDEYVLDVSAAYFAALPGTTFFSGHTHVQGLWRPGEKTYCNPGSVGQPRDGDPRAAFAAWDRASGAIELRRVEYDIDAACRMMAAAGFERRYYENLRAGTAIGGGVTRVANLDG